MYHMVYSGAVQPSLLTYTTLDGAVLDLSDLSEEERAYFERCVAAYRTGMDAAAFNNAYLFGPENPAWVAAGGLITRTVFRTPLFQAAHDLGDRLGIREGTLPPEGDWRRDPLMDEWVAAPVAAAEKGVTLPGLHKAIGRGDVLARPGSSTRHRLLVSRRSLERWRPNPTRQAARKGR